MICIAHIISGTPGSNWAAAAVRASIAVPSSGQTPTRRRATGPTGYCATLARLLPRGGGAVGVGI
jgi:hypothetical protein